MKCKEKTNAKEDMNKQKKRRHEKLYSNLVTWTEKSLLPTEEGTSQREVHRCTRV